MLKIFSLSSIVFSLVVFSSCANRGHRNEYSIGGYDISKDDQYILFSFEKGDHASICRIDINGSGFKEIIPQKKDTNYYSPKYSKNGEKILFIADSKNKPAKSSIYIANPDGSNQEKIICDSSLITSAFFSECEDKIYFIKANSYGHYSPLGHDQPHDEDIYSVNLKSKRVDRITNLAAYGIFKISEYDCRHILMFMPMEEKGGMILFSKDSSNVITRINPANHPRADLTMYYTPLYSKQYNMLGFVATYELMIMDMKDKRAKTIVDMSGKSQVNDFTFFNTKKRILYTIENDMNFNMINFDRSDSTSIAIPVLSK